MKTKLVFIMLVLSMIVSVMVGELFHIGKVNVHAVEVSDVVIEDFENGLNGWAAGDGSSGIGTVSTFVNAPKNPFEGNYALEVTADNSFKADVWKSAIKEFSTAINVESTPLLNFAVNSYGLLNAVLEVKVDIYSNSTWYSYEKQTITPNSWNELTVDLSYWSGVTTMEKIKLSFRAAGRDLNWAGRAQFDYVVLKPGHNTQSTIWEFNDDGYFADWIANSSLNGAAVKGGSLHATVVGTDPNLRNNSVHISASGSPYFTIQMKNKTDGTKARLYWRTDENAPYNQTMSKEFDILPQSNYYAYYSVDLSTEADWKDTIVGIRLDLPDDAQVSSGEISVTSIEFGSEPKEIYYPGAVQPVEATSTHIAIRGTIGGSKSVQLSVYEMKPYEELDVADVSGAIATANLQGGDPFELTVTRYVYGEDRAYNKFIVVVDDGQSRLKLAPTQYVSLFPPSVNQFPYPTAVSKKGIQMSNRDDPQKLAVSHGNYNMVINRLLLKENLNPNDSIPFTVDGKTYYFRKDVVETMDKNVKSASDVGILVTLIVYLNANLDYENSVVDILKHPDNQGGTVAAINTTDGAGIEYWRALMEFLANRYSREDQQYGRVVNYVIGNEIDSAGVWNNMGKKELAEYVNQYNRTFRIAYTAVKKYYDNARLYISLDHLWNKTHLEQPWEYYKGIDILDEFNYQTTRGGNINWNIAAHPYPEDLYVPTFWNDVNATNSVNPKYLTFKNINVLTEYIRLPRFLYNGQPRRVALTEQGFHTTSNTQQAQMVQAAAYAYSHYIAEFNDGIDYYTYNTHFDRDKALKLGLWTLNEGTGGPGVHKYIWDVFQKIDTDESLQVSEFAKSIIGISDWSDVIPQFDSNRIVQKQLPVRLPAEVNQAIQPTVYIGGFEGSDEQGWGISDYSVSALKTSGENVSPFEGNGLLKVAYQKPVALGGSRLMNSVMKRFDVPIDMTNTSQFQFAVYVPNFAAEVNGYTVTVRFYSGTEQIAEAITSSINPGQWNTVSVHMESWQRLNQITAIKIGYNTQNIAVENGTMFIDSIGFAPATEKLLYNFENSNQGWTAGANVVEISSKKSFLNGPRTPYLGSYALAAKANSVPAADWKTVHLQPAVPIDLSGASEFFYHMNAYGLQNATLEGKVTLYSGAETLSKTVEISPNKWNKVHLQVGDWAYKHNITGIDISFRALGRDVNWAPEFQIDYTGYKIAGAEAEDDVIMTPFWSTNTMYHESLLMVSNAGGLPEAPLLFTPNQILSVKNARLNIEYEEGRDWIYDNAANKIKLPAGSRAASLTTEQLYPATAGANTRPKVGGGYVLFDGGHYFHDQQLVVSYTHNANVWNGPIPVYDETKLPNTIHKLKNGDPLKVVLYGDSISVGAQVSSFTGVPPYLPNWGELVKLKLQSTYTSAVTFDNSSVGGKDSAWGAANVHDRVSSKNPNLVVIGFGMNDGTANVAPESYKANIQTIMNDVYGTNPNAEFILVATMMKNPETLFAVQQANYKPQLQSLLGTSTVLADITGVHQELLNHKKYRDMTGNNVNHPGDYLTRWYAQTVAGLLVDPDL